MTTSSGTVTMQIGGARLQARTAVGADATVDHANAAFGNVARGAGDRPLPMTMQIGSASHERPVTEEEIAESGVAGDL